MSNRFEAEDEYCRRHGINPDYEGPEEEDTREPEYEREERGPGYYGGIFYNDNPENL
jgi:hypothetical protein